MKLVATIDDLNTPGIFASCRRRIILHAAVYGAFAKSEPHRNGLETAINNPEFKHLDVIAIEPGSCAEWTSPFLDALRFGISRQGVLDEIDSSHEYLTELATSYPDKVRLHRAHRLPCLPIIVADDTLIFGQYAHAQLHAPHGFWGLFQTDVERLLNWTETGEPPSGATSENIAAFRLVNECVRAMNNPKRDHHHDYRKHTIHTFLSDRG